MKNEIIAMIEVGKETIEKQLGREIKLWEDMDEIIDELKKKAEKIKMEKENGN